jgi:hypothetical protein
MTTMHLTQVKQLNTKAMLVRFSISKPTTSKRDTSAEQFTQTSLHDTGLKVSATLFKEKSSPVRVLLNSANAAYHFHKENTLPYIDRGPRLLPVGNYERYRDTMRQLIREVNQELRQVMPDYHQHVANDITLRGMRASLTDYPYASDFENSFKLEFTFSPLPDESHFLFDIAEDDRAALTTQLLDVEAAARADLYARLRDPIMKLIAKLNIPAGEPGAIFRDTAVTNINDAIDIARQLAMGDETILQMCDEVALTIAPVKDNPDMLRESPVVREAAAAKLKAVSDRMAFMFGGAA